MFEHFSAAADAPGRLRDEGRDMRDALVHDLQALQGVSASILASSEVPSRAATNSRGGGRDQDQRLRMRFEQACAEADAVIVIAPETDGLLAGYVELARRRCLYVLNATAEVIHWAADKRLTAERLAAAGVRVPVSCAGPTATRWIGKPRDGAGGEGVHLLARKPLAPDPEAWYEPFIPGTPGSVALLFTADGPRWLPPVRQRFRAPRFEYLGGTIWSPPSMVARVRRLVEPTLPLFENCLGWIGLDLILGNANDGSEDVVIEVNPRLTSSYVALRAHASDNLGALMLSVMRCPR
ncbi:MAG: ATP-grasp domain-containing protein [Planctomycetota bacterium]